MKNTIDTHAGDSACVDTRRKVIFAGVVGNVMEWYDFAVYGYFASIIGTHFPPQKIHRSH